MEGGIGFKKEGESTKEKVKKKRKRQLIVTEKWMESAR